MNIYSSLINYHLIIYLLIKLIKLIENYYLEGQMTKYKIGDSR